MNVSQEQYEELISLPPEDRVADHGDPVTNKIMGILVSYGHIYSLRDSWVDIITTRDAEREIKQLIKDCGGSI